MNLIVTPLMRKIIRFLLYIILILAVGIFLFYIQDWLRLEDTKLIRKVEVGQLLGIVLQLVVISTIAYFLNKKLSADLKRREMLSGYFEELKEKLTDLNDRVMKNAENTTIAESEYIYRKFHTLFQFVSDIKKKCDHSNVKKLFYSLPEDFATEWLEYWHVATDPTTEQMGIIHLSHEELQSKLRSWQMGLYFK